jgi:DNA-directed RNA polymerase subunit RPC12/RpoP
MVDNPYGPFDAAGGHTIKCPYCSEPDFDAPGLKSHLLTGDCEEWNATEVLTRVFSTPVETKSCLYTLEPHTDREYMSACGNGFYLRDGIEMYEHCPHCGKPVETRSDP